VVVNLSRYAQFVELDLSDYKGAVPVEMFGNTAFPAITDELYLLTLGPHSFYWFDLQPETAPQEMGETVLEPEKLPLFEVQRRWEELFEHGLSQRLTGRISKYLITQRWFGAKNRRIKSLSIRDILPIKDGPLSAFMLLLDIQFADGVTEAYTLTVDCVPGEVGEELIQKYPRAVLSRVRIAGEDQLRYLVDALVRDQFCLALLKMIARRTVIRGANGKMTAISSREFKSIHREDEMPYEISLSKAEQSNTSVIFGNRFILKLFRRLQEGTNPDLEIGRFLTRKGFVNRPAVAGALEYSEDRREPATLAILQAYVPNEGDAWAFTLDQLYRFFENILTLTGEEFPGLPDADLLVASREEVPKEVAERIGAYLNAVHMLADRTAGMHTILALEKSDPAFVPERFSRLYQRSLYQSMRMQAGQVLPQFRKSLPGQPQAVRELGERVLARREEIIGVFGRLLENRLTGKRVRCHGDYHLGQVLYTGKDFVIIDFEGEPARPVSERKIKRSPLRDVAGMLRSFHYVAYNALMHEQTRGLFKPEKRPFLEAWADYWYRWVAVAFMGRYLKSSRTGGYLPENTHETKILLNAFLMEKAIYELGYEMNNRPDWVHIPLLGIEQLLGAAD